MLKQRNLCDIPWDALAPIGSKWHLQTFKASALQSWEDFWAEQRRYWGADSPGKSRFQHYFGADNTEESFLEKTRKRYAEHVQHRKRWKGLCKIGETVEVVSIEPQVIALSKNWQGRISDHSDLEIWLKEERTRFLIKRVRFCCEIYNFGTIAVTSGSLPNLIGEAAGSSRVSHLVGRDETVAKSAVHGTIAVGDAVFKILE